MSAVLSISAAGQPAAQASTNSACRTEAAISLLQGRVRGTREPHKLAQLGATPSPATISRPGNPGAAPELAGTDDPPLPHNIEERAVYSVMQLPPVPARSFAGWAYGLRPGAPAPAAFFLYPRRFKKRPDGALLFLMTLNGGLH